MHEVRISASDLACRKGERVLFRGLSVALEPGQALQVSGANGVGKSSLLRLMAGLAKPFAGQVRRQGAVSLVDERPALDPELPLERALAFWRRIDGGALVDLEPLGLVNLLDVPVRYLSTGQRKRAAMARLLGQDAGIWLLDEPLNGLDTQAVRLVEELTARHCAAGGIALIASHQPFTMEGKAVLALQDYVP